MTKATKIQTQLDVLKEYIEVQTVFFPWRTDFSGQEIGQVLNNHGIGMTNYIREKVLTEGIFSKCTKSVDGSLSFYL